LDLRGYRPAQVAANLNKPMLILQGGRDYQVTVEGDCAAWQRALAERSDVMFRVYPADNHFFSAGSGRSTPAESEPAQHMDPEVISEIAAWIGRGRQEESLEDSHWVARPEDAQPGRYLMSDRSG
jgi:uncharacterized protein